jgi:hypothetical protein
LSRGTVPGTAEGGGPDIYPHKYSYLTKIPDLVRFYLIEIGGGPVKVTKMIDDLNRGGANVYSRRPRKGENKDIARPLVRSDITKLFSDLRSGYNAEKQKTSSPFAMDMSLDTVRLVPYEERTKKPGRRIA